MSAQPEDLAPPGLLSDPHRRAQRISGADVENDRQGDHTERPSAGRLELDGRDLRGDRLLFCETNLSPCDPRPPYSPVLSPRQTPHLPHDNLELIDQSSRNQR